MTLRTFAAVCFAFSICGCASNNPNTAGGAVAPSTCLTSTGSRIAAGPGTCSATGRSYSQTDLQQTGKTTVAGALGNLDPSLTISH
jgi:hypothetical protein